MFKFISIDDIIIEIYINNKAQEAFCGLKKINMFYKKKGTKLTPAEYSSVRKENHIYSK